MSRDTLARLARLPVAVVLVALMVLAGGAHYVVSPGDTLSSIARQESVTVADLAAANGIENPDMILAGTPLVLPSKSTATPAGVGSHQTHLVARGESIASIAANHGVAVGQIEEANGIVNGVIYAGTTLRLSGSGFVARTGGVLRHVSSSDETVSHIALHHGVTAHDLAHANDLAENSRVSAGQVHRSPHRGSVPCLEPATSTTGAFRARASAPTRETTCSRDAVRPFGHRSAGLCLRSLGPSAANSSSWLATMATSTPEAIWTHSTPPGG